MATTTSSLGSRLSARARRRYDGSAVEDFVTRLSALHFVTTITMFGAAFLLSTLPFVILMGSLAERRVEDDVAEHLGLNPRATGIVEQLFQSSPERSTSAIVVAVLLGLAGTIALAGSVQSIYEQIFTREHRRAGNLPRLLLWVAGLVGWLLLDGLISDASRGLPAGSLLDAIAVATVTVGFFWWSMHVLLAGMTPWRTLLVPAVATGAFWIGLEGFSALYFSSAVISDSQLYGSIGVVFSLLTWFIAIAAVVVLGALTGDVLQQRRVARSSDRPADEGDC
jgi:membrane protein